VRVISGNTNKIGNPCKDSPQKTRFHGMLHSIPAAHVYIGLEELALGIAISLAEPGRIRLSANMSNFLEEGRPR
jgi:hypothetical protein